MNNNQINIYNKYLLFKSLNMWYSFNLQLLHWSDKSFTEFKSDFLWSANWNSPANTWWFHFINYWGIYKWVTLEPIQIYSALTFWKFLYKCEYLWEDDEKIFIYNANNKDYSEIKDIINDLVEEYIINKNLEAIVIKNYKDTWIYDTLHKAYINTHIIINKNYLHNIIIKEKIENKYHPDIYPLDFM